MHLWEIVRRSVAKRKRVRRRKSSLPPLPQHQQGLEVKKGDTFRTGNITFSLKDLDENKRRAELALSLGLPSWAGSFSCGAIFHLERPLNPVQLHVGASEVRIPPHGKHIEVAFKHAQQEIHISAYRLAEQALDVIAAQSFDISEIMNPLREYCIWWKGEDGIVLRSVSTMRFAPQMHFKVEILDPDGNRRTQQKPTLSWHPSLAYFRRAQAATDLHEAYRNLFLALEALLSEVCPWSRGDGERRWLQAALKHVVEGYGLDMRKYITRLRGNPYRQFIKEQYSVRRCALFHAKLSERPIIPGDIKDREELVRAADNLNKLYIELAKRVTGFLFPSSVVAERALDDSVSSMLRGDFYLDASVNGSTETVKLNKIDVEKI
ncbi:hypothetical protein [Iodidimonas nitroreducens]|nr:hypothetical protein [Iodidimonas nitroreducens]